MNPISVDQCAALILECAEDLRRTADALDRNKARIDASNRVLCQECGGTDPTCFWCDGSGFIDDLSEEAEEEETQERAA